MTIKVLVVDDSAVMRGLLTSIINATPDLRVVGSADNAYEARELIKSLAPDVLTLDVEMPQMNGIEFLSRLMRLRPMPVLMISSLTEEGTATTLQSLELGAVDFLGKPRAHSNAELAHYAEEVCDKLRAAYSARHRLKQIAVNTATASQSSAAMPAAASASPYAPSLASSVGLRPSSGGGAAAGGITGGMAGATLSRAVLDSRIIAIGASTGGTEAIKDVLVPLPPETPGIVIVQHMPEGFTKSFAKRLDSLSRLTVVEAEGGERILPGHAYLAPGSAHLLVRKRGGSYYTELSDAPPVNRHRPSVDVLFNSVAEAVGKHALGIMLTGMGKDGAQGMLKMRQQGAWNIGQSEESCVVYGMPREAALAGAVDEVVALNHIAERLLHKLRSFEAV
jgi:two-component system chemotaxis response regulator CheB